MRFVVIAGLTPVLVSCVAALADVPRPPLSAVVVADQVCWKAKRDVPFTLQLHSASLERPTSVEKHDFQLPQMVFGRDHAIAWHIRDQQLWVLACYVGQHAWGADYPLVRMPCSFHKANVTAVSQHIAVPPTEAKSPPPLIDHPSWKHVVARCPILFELHFKLASGKDTPPFYFDFVPVGADRGKLFVLQADRPMTVWEFSPVAGRANADEGIEGASLLDDKRNWTRIEEIAVDFFEPFQIYLQEQDPIAVTASGNAYTLRIAGVNPVQRAFRKQGPRPIVAVIDDSRTGKAYAFTKTSCYWLKEPASAKPFDFPDITDDQNKTAETLVRAVEFLDAK